MQPELKSDATRALQSAQVFLINQLSSTQPAWGNSPNDQMDPWPTGHILYHLPLKKYRLEILEAIAWIKTEQKVSGAWGTSTYGVTEDASATSDVLIALVHHLSVRDVSFRRGLSFLCDTYDNGWTLSRRFGSTKVYSTSAALRALSRGDRDYLPSLIIPDACSTLLAMRNPDGAWPQVAGLASDPSFTAFALHGLLDVQKYWALEIPESVIRNASEFLITQQAADGSWTDWHGIQGSPDATGHII
jgi:squalene cyclase